MLVLSQEIEGSSSLEERESSCSSDNGPSKFEQIPSPKASRSPSSYSSSQRPDLRTGRLTPIVDFSKDHETLQHINRLLNRSRKMIVLTGAGISCNAGIPDFRSSTGLYDLVKRQFPELSIRSGQEMFDISLFRDEMKISVFATFMEKLYSSVKLAQPTKTHKFIAHLKNRNKLLRCYTQNIDGLEEVLGLEMSSNRNNSSDGFNSQWKNYDVVQLHGDLNTLSCTSCFHVFSWNRFWSRSFRRGELPTCPSCEEKNHKRSIEGKRNTQCTGYLRPNIVLYGENHPSCEFIAQGLSLDILRGRPDFFIIMGTSLKVDGVRRVVKQISKQVHERGGIVILVNKTSIGDSSWHGVIDYQIMCDCDTWVTYLENQIPEFFKKQEQIDKMRQLKREASDLRKKRLEEQKACQELNNSKDIFSTPPQTPIKQDDTKANDNEQYENSTRSVKRRLLTSDSAEPRLCCKSPYKRAGPSLTIKKEHILEREAIAVVDS